MTSVLNILCEAIICQAHFTRNFMYQKDCHLPYYISYTVSIITVTLNFTILNLSIEMQRNTTHQVVGRSWSRLHHVLPSILIIISGRPSVSYQLPSSMKPLVPTMSQHPGCASDIQIYIKRKKGYSPKRWVTMGIQHTSLSVPPRWLSFISFNAHWYELIFSICSSRFLLFVHCLCWGPLSPFLSHLCLQVKYEWSPVLFQDHSQQFE